MDSSRNVLPLARSPVGRMSRSTFRPSASLDRGDKRPLTAHGFWSVSKFVHASMVDGAGKKVNEGEKSVPLARTSRPVVLG